MVTLDEEIAITHPTSFGHAADSITDFEMKEDSVVVTVTDSEEKPVAPEKAVREKGVPIDNIELTGFYLIPGRKKDKSKNWRLLYKKAGTFSRVYQVSCEPQAILSDTNVTMEMRQMMVMYRDENLEAHMREV